MIDVDTFVATDDRKETGSTPATVADRPSAKGITMPTATVRGVAAMWETLERGAKAGRYVIVDQIGAGGMGVVYRAHDPELDRDIALKLMRTGRGSSDVSGGAARLLREAQALAQLSHPNVVSAHDVGTLDDAVFIAMELVEGQTLKQWLAAETRSSREIVRVLVDAGRGLAAAHEAGLVHRDFKPANVIVGDDGRARVVDFGLSRASGSPTESGLSTESDDDGRSELHRLSAAVTRADAIIGTPAYMAPEQHVGGVVDARSDQFAFCVTAYEALYGARPFAGRSRSDLEDNVCAGRIREPPPGAKVPRRLRRLLLRGLSADPARRHPSMNALLDALEVDPGAARRRIAAGVLAVGIVAASVGFAISQRGGGEQPCRGARDKLAGVWDDDARAAVRASFLAVPVPRAADAYERFTRVLDDRADAWVAMRTDACRATRVRGEQSDELLDLRMRCLDRRLAEMQALVELFSKQVDAETVDRAVQAAYALAALEPCADAEALNAVLPLPGDAAVRDRVGAARAQLDEAAALRKAGEYAEALAIAERVVADARATDYPPLLAEALVELGSVRSRTGESELALAALYEATEIAATARHDRVLAEASLQIAYVLAIQKLRYDEAMAVGRLAESVVLRSGGDPALRADIATTIGFVHSRQDELDAALASFDAAQELWESAVGADHPNVAHVLNQRAWVSARLGRYDEATAAIERALVIWERALGPSHPKVAIGLNNLGQFMVEAGEPKRAIPKFERALSIYEAALGAQHPKVAIAAVNIGETRAQLGDCDAALPPIERALSIWSASLEPDHPYVATAQNALGKCLVDVGRPAEAIAPLETSLASRVAREAGDGRVGATRFALARALYAADRDRARAIELARAARAELEAAGEQQELARVTAWLAERR